MWKGLWTREDHDLANLSRHTIALGASSPLVVSGGGEFHPVLLGLDGLAELGNHIDQVTVGDSVYDLVAYGDDLMFALPGESLPRAFLSTANFSALESTPPTPTEQPGWMRRYDDQADGGAADFALGIGAGLLWTIPANLIGLWDGTKYVVRQGWNYIPPRMVYRWITTGDPRTVEDQRNFETAKGVALKLANVLFKMQQDRDAFLYAMWTGDDETAVAIGEEYRVALELAAEMLDTLSEDVDALPAYEQGKIYGRIIGEVVVTVAGSFATAGGALAAKGATMASVATRLKQVSFLQRFNGKFDEMIAFYTKVDELVEGVETGVTDGKVIASRIASIIAYRQHKTGEGAWDSFEHFLTATDDPWRKAVVDSHLLFAANIAMRGAYKEAADLIRAGDAAGGLAKVPTISRVNQLMDGRRRAAGLEAHHAATQQWVKVLKPGITQSQLDSMPALLLSKYWHQYNSNLPRDYVFHTILRERMRIANPRTNAQIIEQLRQTYRQFEGVDVGEPDPDVWIVTKAWLDSPSQP